MKVLSVDISLQENVLVVNMEKEKCPFCGAIMDEKEPEKK